MGLLEGRKIVVTAGSKGIGASIVKKAFEEGAEVFFCSRQPEQFDLKNERIYAGRCDLTKETDILNWSNKILAMGTPDGVVINHGGPPSGDFEDLSPEDWDEGYKLLIRSSVVLLKNFLPVMKDKGKGNVVFMTSVSVKKPLPSLVLSNTLRMSLIGLMKSLVGEYSKYGLRFNMVLPGYTETERVVTLAQNIAEKENIDIGDVYRRWESLIPLSRLAKPEEIADAVIYLLSDKASYINGVLLPVDGGFLV